MPGVETDTPHHTMFETLTSLLCFIFSLCHHSFSPSLFLALHLLCYSTWPLHFLSLHFLSFTSFSLFKSFLLLLSFPESIRLLFLHFLFAKEPGFPPTPPAQCCFSICVFTVNLSRLSWLILPFTASKKKITKSVSVCISCAAWLLFLRQSILLNQTSLSSLFTSSFWNCFPVLT